MEKMGKRVLLINTAEILSRVGSIPFYGSVCGSYAEQKKQERCQHWKGVQIPYYQCDNNMPNRQKLNELLKMIRDMAPAYVVLIGGMSILGNLVNKMIPALTIGLCPSNLEYTTTKYQALGKIITEEDRKLLGMVGFSDSHVIESIFTSSLKPQTEHIARKDIGVEKDNFLLVTVGARLNNEITDEFLSLLNDCMKPDMKWIILGSFSKCNEYLEKYPILKQQTINLGFCNDILSRMELCDLYVNPTRRGGGTSCVEAMYKSVPVVTVNFGDVATNVGEDFCVADYSEMKQKIEQYYLDKNYYISMQKKALQRVEILLDTDKEFVRIIQEMEKREREQMKLT